MKENSIEELKQMLDELYQTQQARLACNADDLDIREEIAEVENEIKELQDDASDDREDNIKNEQSSIEEDIKDIEKYISFTSKRENFSHDTDWNWNKDLANKIEHILSDYKRVLKENEELKQDRNNNYQMIALAQNEVLGYMQGYEDGKKLNRSAVACVVENQQYYIIKKEIEHYKENIEKLQKENELAKKQVEYDKTHIFTSQTIKLNYIPIQKVKDKIEEKEWAIKSYDCDTADYKQSQAIGAWQVLQELIEGRK